MKAGFWGSAASGGYSGGMEPTTHSYGNGNPFQATSSSYDAALQGRPSYINGSSSSSSYNPSGSVRQPVGLNGASMGAKLLSGDHMFKGSNGGYTEDPYRDHRAPDQQDHYGNYGAPPMASVGVDLDGDGRPDVTVTGIDRDHDGIPDAMQKDRRSYGVSTAPAEPVSRSYGMPDMGYINGHGSSYAMPATSSRSRTSSPQPMPRYQAPPPMGGAYQTATPVRIREPQMMGSTADVNYGFPTAGSFAAEPYREGGSPMYSSQCVANAGYSPSQPSYPSAYVDRSRSSSPMPARVSQTYGAPSYGGSSAAVSYGAGGPGMHREVRSYSSCGNYAGRSYSPPPGVRSNGFTANPYAAPSGCAGNSYSYGGGGGGCYSGGTLSYAPAPGRSGSYSPSYGGAPPSFGAPQNFGTSSSLSFANRYGFPTAGSFVAEPFAAHAPVMSPMVSRTPSFVPPPMPAQIGGFGLSGFGEPMNGYSSPQYGGAYGLGGGLGSFNAGFSGGYGGTTSPFVLPPNGSFLADPAASFVAPVQGAFGAGLYGGSRSPSPMPMGSRQTADNTRPGAQGSTMGSGRGRPTEPSAAADRSSTPQPSGKKGPAASAAGPRPPGVAPKTKKKPGRAGCC